MKLKNRLFLRFLLFSLIPMFVIGIVTYIISYRSILSNTISLTKEIMRRATNEIDSTIVLTESIAESLQYEPYLQAAMRESIISNDYEERISTLQINTLLSLIQGYIKPNIYGIYCVGENGRQFKSNTLSMPYVKPQELGWYQEIFVGTAPVWYPPHTTSLIATTGNIDFISFGTPFIDKLTGKRNGIVLVELRASIFEDLIQNIDILDISHYFILDKENNVISASSPDAAKNQDFLITAPLKYEQKLSNGWTMVSTISQENIANEAVETLTVVMSIVVAVTIVCSLLISMHMSKQISDPINHLMELMEQVENGNFSVSMPEMKHNYEMKNLSRSFNAMVKKSNEFLHQLTDDQISLRKAHFAALQAQINPHFLYNSLDTVAWNIRMNQRDEAIDTLMTLTKFFRRSLSKGEEIVKLKSELEHAALYLRV